MQLLNVMHFMQHASELQTIYLIIMADRPHSRQWRNQENSYPHQLTKSHTLFNTQNNNTHSQNYMVTLNINPSNINTNRT